MFGKIGLYFDNDESAGGDLTTGADPEKGKKPEWTAEQQAEFDKRAAALRKAAAEEARKKTLAEIEEKQKAEKEEADKKAFAEQGKFKEAADLAEKARLEAEKKAAEAQSRVKELELKDSFRATVGDLGLKFVNTQAEKDAFAVLDKEGADDEAGMKAAVEKLQKDRPYLFGEVEEPEGTDALERGKKRNTKETDKEKEERLRSRLNLRKPR